MKTSIVCLVLLSIYGAQGQMYGGDWMGDLFRNIERMKTDIQSNVMNMNQNLQANIRNSVGELTSDIQRVVAEAGNSSQGVNFGTNVGSVSINSGSGISRSVISGYGTNGEPYRRESEERVVGNILYRTDKIYNLTSGKSNTFRYSFDLTNPDATPVLEQE